MSVAEVDDYLAGLDEQQRRALEGLRATILEIAPEAEQGLSYGVPGFRVDGNVVAGFAAFKKHLGYYPHSDSVLHELGDEVAGYSCSKGTLRFTVDTPLPKALVRRLIEVRLRQLDAA